MGGATMKYYKLDNQVYAFESGGSQDAFINPEMTLMTDNEVDRHINPQNYLSAEQKQEQYLASLRPLTRRQFKLALLHADLTTTIEQAIADVADAKLKAVLEIEYTEATEFVRTSESVAYICNLLELSDDEINAVWENALTL